MTDPRETAVQALAEIRVLLAQADHDPDTPAGAAIDGALLVIARTLGAFPESMSEVHHVNT